MIVNKMEENKKMDYNTQRKILSLPEYGRNVQKMVEYLKSIEDRDKRNEQARAVVKVMEILNPQVHLQEDYEHKLWDHLHIISGFTLDVDSPYPVPAVTSLTERPKKVPIEKKPIRASHYGRNIENIINLIAEKEDGEVKTAMIHSLAIYMRQQYLIWNKDTVADETIFKDIESLSDNRIVVPEGLKLAKLSPDSSFSRPAFSNSRQQRGGGNRHRGNQWKNQRNK